mmetsp:Transcript_3644/g.6710  ORF Transcript_3644/g.6710 Transcript_3644/m.6710 type:complete len:249 (+) Transcript_3644:164-910(+)
MLPHVATKQRGLVEAQRVHAVLGLGDSQRAVGILDQPAPAGTELAGTCGGELRLELGDGAEALVQGVFQLGRHRGRVGAHHFPELVMVPQLADVVENTRLRDSVGIIRALDDFFEGFAFPLRALNRLVAVVDIGLVVQVVVIFQRLGGHAMGGKSVVRIGKVWKFKGHGVVPLFGCSTLRHRWSVQPPVVKGRRQNPPPPRRCFPCFPRAWRYCGPLPLGVNDSPLRCRAWPRLPAGRRHIARRSGNR